MNRTRKIMGECRNPRCGEILAAGDWPYPLCWSCRYVGKWAFALGALLAGAIVRFIR